MSDVVIRVENLFKEYRLGAIGGGTVREDLARWWAKRRGKADPTLKIGEADHGNRNGEQLLALQDVSFEVKQGEVLGIIGRNGAGKSTLLKILSRVTSPTSGAVKVKGRIASLLEVGTGFHPELTGRENVYLNGAILGMRRHEIDRKFEEIVDFSGVEQFIDTPVKRYSSGMKVRLAFAVAAHLEPEILLVDEVLAVGDAEFQQKCLGKMGTVAKAGRTVLFVSHNMSAIQNICDRGILLHSGNVQIDATTQLAVNAYFKSIETTASKIDVLNRRDRTGKGQVKLAKINIYSGPTFDTLKVGKPAQFEFEVISSVSAKIDCIFTIYNQYGQPIAHFNSTIRSPEDVHTSVTCTKLICEIDELLIMPGTYRINTLLLSDGEEQDHLEAAATFEIESGIVQQRYIEITNSYSNTYIRHRWVSVH